MSLSSDRLRPFQWGLGYLIYLLTLFAVGFALMRPIFHRSTSWWVTTGAAIYVAFLLAYFAIRVPILRRRLREDARKLKAGRHSLVELSRSKRSLRSAHEPESGGHDSPQA